MWQDGADSKDLRLILDLLLYYIYASYDFNSFPN